MCLERLAPLQREVLDHVKQGQTNREIADALGIPEVRVRHVKFRALRRMRELLRRFGHRPMAGEAGGEQPRETEIGSREAGGEP
jgi:DNA-directed RNA polymerase specialized sigma24 family protein